MSEDAFRFTAGQRNHLEVIFGSLITESEDLIEWSRRVPSGGDPRTARWLEGLREDLETLLESLRRTAEEISITVWKREEDPRRKLAAWSSTWWAHVLDCRPSALKAWGKVDPDLAPVLAPAVEEIAERLLHIERRAERRG